MPFLATLVGKLVAGVVVVALVGLGFGGWAYATDQQIAADVVEKSCPNFGLNQIVAKTRLFGIVREVEVDHQQCSIVPQDAYILYSLQSGRTVIYEAEGGRCIWDTSLGPCGSLGLFAP